MAFKDANHLRPRRGSVTGMASSTIVLAAGELFLEYPQTGVGTGASKIKIGDGVTQYKDLPYAIDLAEMGGSTVDFTTDTSTTVAEALAKVVSGQTLSVDVAALKQAVNLLNGEAVKTITSTGSTITVTGSGNSINIEANPTGAISTVYDTDLTASKAVVSNASGKLVSATATAAEVDYLSGVTSAVQTQINGKQATITGAATSITDTDLTASMAVVSDANGKVAVSAVTATELGYVSGVTSAIQTQINGKSDNGHTHTMSEVTDLYGDFTGATSAAAGATGFVPAPAAGDEDKYLAGNGSWVAFTTATTAADGLMSATDKAFIEGLKAADAYDFGDETPSV